MKVTYRATFTDGKHAHVTIDAGNVNSGFFKALGVIRRDYPRKELAGIAYWHVQAEVSDRQRRVDP